MRKLLFIAILSISVFAQSDFKWYPVDTNMIFMSTTGNGCGYDANTRYGLTSFPFLHSLIQDRGW